MATRSLTSVAFEGRVPAVIQAPAGNTIINFTPNAFDAVELLTVILHFNTSSDTIVVTGWSAGVIPLLTAGTFFVAPAAFSVIALMLISEYTTGCCAVAV